MKFTKIFLLVFVAILIGACGNPEKKAHKASAKASEAEVKVHEERLELVEQYKECVEKAGEDKAKVEACDSYLKAAEALK
jgi:hypothetical protein